MTLKVHINPSPEQIALDNGIGQVVHAQYRHLPEHGIVLVSNPADADIIAGHIQQGDLPRIDVLMSHGLYWTGDPGSGTYHAWHHEANRRILDAARKAYLVTVPSEWVAMPFKRDMRISPVVIGHGIDLDSLPPVTVKRGDYVLWNKNRASDVCSVQAAQELAGRGFKVVSTYGTPGENMQIIGPQPHKDMMRLVRNAEFYLATTKETFGIGTLEALAQGVPVIGYRWGGTAELVTPECGILVEPGDIDGLVAAIATLEGQDLSRKCVKRAASFTWEYACKQYADVYHRAYAMKQAEQERNGVSVIITNYNYARYVGGAMESILYQSFKATEVIIVDDGSTDDSDEHINRVLLDARNASDATWTYIQQPNQGVAAARNEGIANATQNFIVCLDADDELAPDYLKTCHEAMIQDRDLGIACTGLSWIDSDPPRNIWHSAFSWEEQATPGVPPRTTIPCAAMFRRDMWQRAGGYQQIYAPAEDAEFFTRGLSVGYTARQVTQDPLFLYRNTPDSASKTKPYRPIDTWHPWMRDKEFPMAAPAKVQPLVRSYSEPLVTVVIPVGPGHSAKVAAAIDSLLGQTFRNWAVVVVDDSEHDAYLHNELFTRYPFMTLVGNYCNQGAGAARNLGLYYAKSPLVLWLDADDYLLPTALEAMVKTYMDTTPGFVYTDWYEASPDGLIPHETRPYDQHAWLERPWNAVSALMATEDARSVGGFDTDMPGWEDWDFYIKLSIAGKCGVRLPEALLVYRPATGNRRVTAMARQNELLGVLHDRYAGYMTGETDMKACCGGNGDAILQAKRLGSGGDQNSAPAEPMASGKVRMEFIGDQVGAVSYYAPGNKEPYRGGRDPLSRYVDARPQDVAFLESIGVWKAISPMPVVQPAPTPIAEIIAPQVFNPGPLPLDDGITPEQEAAMNRAAVEEIKTRRGKR